MKRIILVAVIIMLATTTACTSTLSHGDKTSDDAHGFLVHSTQIIGQIDKDIAPEGKVFLIMKYEIQNLRSENDSNRQWTEQITLTANDETYEPTLIDSLDNQLWQTALSKDEAKAGYIAYVVPEDIHDFKLTFAFPVSATETVYQFRPIDKRISVNVDYVLTRLGQIERTKRIPLIGELMAGFSSSPIRYLGTILVLEEEISQLLEQTKNLSEDAKRQIIEDYLAAKGHCRLE